MEVMVSTEIRSPTPTWSLTARCRGLPLCLGKRNIQLLLAHYRMLALLLTSLPPSSTSVPVFTGCVCCCLFIVIAWYVGKRFPSPQTSRPCWSQNNSLFILLAQNNTTQTSLPTPRLAPQRKLQLKHIVNRSWASLCLLTPADLTLDDQKGR